MDEYYLNQRRVRTQQEQQEAIRQRGEAQRLANYQAELQRQAEIEAEKQLRAEYNASLLEQHRAAVRAEKARVEAEKLAALEEVLAPRRQQIEREWLIAHPGYSSTDFEAVWPLVRQGLVEELAQKRQVAAGEALTRLLGPALL